MSIKLVDPGRSALISTTEENQIRGIFYEHWEKMKTEMKRIMEEIDTWRSKRILDINSYAEKQIRLLEADYNDQRATFDKSRRENIETAKSYAQSKAGDPFKELCDACQKLVFQVAQLGYIQQEDKFPSILTVEDQRQGKKPNQSSTHVNEVDDRRVKSMAQGASVTEKNDSNYSVLFPQSPSSDRTK